MQIRLASASDLPALHPVIERSYRGDSARAGWTYESDLLDGQRTDLDHLAAVLRSPADRLLIALSDDDAPIGCVQVTDRGEGLSYLGLLCVDPLLQAAGVGRTLITAAERLAMDVFAARTMEMTVIDKRPELIAYYERRGYMLTGEKRPFPIPLDPPYWMVVLAKPLPEA